MLVATSGCTSNKPDLSAQEYNQQGLSLATQGKYKDAVASYTRAIQLNSQEAQFYVNRGTAYLNMKEFDLAIADFDQAIELDPNLAEAYAGRGYAYMSKGGVYLNLAISDFNIILLKSKNADLINYAKQMLENLTKTPPFLVVIPLPPVIDTPPEPIINNRTQEGNVPLGSNTESVYKVTLSLTAIEHLDYSGKGFAMKGEATVQMTLETLEIEVPIRTQEGYYSAKANFQYSGWYYDRNDAFRTERKADDSFGGTLTIPGSLHMALGPNGERQGVKIDFNGANREKYFESPVFTHVWDPYFVDEVFREMKAKYLGKHAFSLNGETWNFTETYEYEKNITIDYSGTLSLVRVR